MTKKAFFGENGISSTSANHIANLGKESIRKAHAYLSSTRFVSEYIRLIGDADRTLISSGLNKESLPDIQGAAIIISKTNALVAYLREAIKEKERLVNEAKAWKDESSRKSLEARRSDLAFPDSLVEITAEDIISEWSVGQLEKYLTLEAKCAAFGKLIHEDGQLNKARTELQDKLSNPRNVSLNGRDTVITEYDPTVTTDEVDGLYFSLQNEYREAQAELNGLKKSLKDEVEARNLKADEDYRLAVADFRRKKAALDNEEKEIEAYEKTQRQELLAEVQSLKIVIPNRLKDVYDYLVSL